METLARDDVDPAFHRFLDLARRHAPLDRRQEVDLIARYRAGDARALDRLVDANLRYVVDIATINADLVRDDMDLMDLCAEGTVALIKAVRRYDERWHGPFKLHLVSRIHRAMTGSAGGGNRVRPAAAASGRRAAKAGSGSRGSASP